MFLNDIIEFKEQSKNKHNGFKPNYFGTASVVLGSTLGGKVAINPAFKFAEKYARKNNHKVNTKYDKLDDEATSTLWSQQGKPKTPEYKKAAQFLEDSAKKRQSEIARNIYKSDIARNGIILGGAVLGGATGYGIYRSGKYVVNRIKNRRKQNKSKFSNNLNTVNFSLGDIANKVVNNKIGGFFLKHGDTVTRTTANGVTKKTKGLFNSGYGLRKRGMAAIGTPLAMYGGYKLKRKYDQYKPEIKMLRAYNNFKNKIQGV